MRRCCQVKSMKVRTGQNRWRPFQWPYGWLDRSSRWVSWVPGMRRPRFRIPQGKGGLLDASWLPELVRWFEPGRYLRRSSVRNKFRWRHPDWRSTVLCAKITSVTFIIIIRRTAVIIQWGSVLSSSQNIFFSYFYNSRLNFCSHNKKAWPSRKSPC